MKKLFVFLLVCALLAAPMTAYAYDYSQDGDITFQTESESLAEALAPSDWALNEVNQAQDAGLITAHTYYGFQMNITRFQFAELAVNMAEKATGKAIAPAAADTFTDCTEPAVLKAYAAGIVNGMGDGTFAPEATTNREQIATMIARAIAYIEADTGRDYTPAAASLEGFTDAGEVSGWAVDGVGLLAANGIMNGTSTTTLSPKSPCTVEQSILLVYRFYTKTQA